MNGVESPGGTNGIAMWTSTNSDWAIYMSRSGANKSFSNGTAIAGYDFVQLAIRFRCFDSPIYGFIFENSNEELCMSINSGTKDVYMANNLKVATALDVGGTVLCGLLKGGQGNSAGNFHIDNATNSGHLYLNYISTGFVYVGNTYYTLFDTSNGTHKQVLKFASGTSSRVLWDFFKKLTPAGQEMAIGAIIYNKSQVSLVQASDIRLKENINPIKNHFEILDKLNPVNFAYKEDHKENPDKLIDGFIADELYESYEFATYGEPGEFHVVFTSLNFTSHFIHQPPMPLTALGKME